VKAAAMAGTSKNTAHQEIGHRGCLLQQVDEYRRKKVTRKRKKKRRDDVDY